MMAVKSGLFFATEQACIAVSRQKKKIKKNASLVLKSSTQSFHLSYTSYGVATIKTES